MTRILARMLLALGAAAAVPAAAQDATYSVRMMTPEAAQKAAGAALAACRKAGYQVAVAVVDRAGLPLVMLRDRFAGPHTPGVATDKAWTAVTFKTDTSELEKITRPGMPQSGMRGVARVTALSARLAPKAVAPILTGSLPPVLPRALSVVAGGRTRRPSAVLRLVRCEADPPVTAPSRRPLEAGVRDRGEPCIADGDVGTQRVAGGAAVQVVDDGSGPPVAGNERRP